MGTTNDFVLFEINFVKKYTRGTPEIRVKNALEENKCQGKK